MTTLTSRQRMLNAISLQETDYIPCSFMSFTALRKQVNEDLYALSKAELRMGLDSFLFVPAAPRPQRPEHPDLRGLPVAFHPGVSIKQWRQPVPGGSDHLHREYSTPGGVLTTEIQLSEDWPHGERIPFIDDYQISRSLKPLITQPEELPALGYLLQPPSQEAIQQFSADARRARQFVEDNEILLVGGWGVGMDMVSWLLGVDQSIYLAATEPGFVSELLEMIHLWNMERMKVVLSAPVDLYIRRAWYEGCDFVMPRFYRQEILPRLKREVDLAHAQGAKFGYICTSGTKPMLDYYLEAGIDVLIGIDPIQGTYTDLPLMKSKLGGRVCLWGGVSGAITVEMGSEDQIRAAVRGAIETLGPAGFILSPVDNITVDAPRTWENIDIFIDEWQKLR
jgi:uroporphyrinogen-III decarboxylase